MGWASGTEIMVGLIDIAQDLITDEEARAEFYKRTINLLKSHDWDCLDEPLGEDDVYDEVYEDLYSYDDDDETDEDYDLVDHFENAEFPDDNDYQE